MVDLFAVYCYFGVFSIGSFWYRLYTYGHNLDPHAPVHIKPFTPLLIGVKQIANFREYSFPQAGAYPALLFGVADRARRMVFTKGADGMRASIGSARAFVLVSAPSPKQSLQIRQRAPSRAREARLRFGSS